MNRYGVNALHGLRHEGLIKEVEGLLERIRPPDDQVSPIGASLEAYLPDLEAIRERLRSDGDQFCELCYRRVLSVSDTIKRKRDPLSGVWSGVMPVFLCGGGSRIPVYEDVVQRYSDWLQMYVHNEGARLIQLPRPQNLRVDLPDAEYHRLGVAWGLSQPAYEIGQFFRPSEIEDVDERTKPEEPWWRREGAFVSKDMV
jgi:hypothetical protein